MKTYIAVGDIHGRADLLGKLLNKIRNYIDQTCDVCGGGGFSGYGTGYGDVCSNCVAGHTGPKRDVTVIFLGDYIDRGYGSKQVIDLLQEFAKEFDVVFLKGNHEQMCLSGDMYWISCGGDATISSYPDKEVSEEHLEWMESLKLYYETEHYIFVHAGLEPGIPFSEQKDDPHFPATALWIRSWFLNSNYNWGKIVVHGHTPCINPQVKTNRINIDTGAVFDGKLTAVILEDTKQPVFLFVTEDPLVGLSR